MREDVREALHSARTVEISRGAHSAQPQRRHSLGAVRAIVLSVVRELPDDMSINELREELELTNREFSNGR